MKFLAISGPSGAQLKDQGIAAGINTRTIDLEAEINGLLTHDRRVRKIPAGELREVARWSAPGNAGVSPAPEPIRRWIGAEGRRFAKGRD